MFGYGLCTSQLDAAFLSFIVHSNYGHVRKCIFSKEKYFLENLGAQPLQICPCQLNDITWKTFLSAWMWVQPRKEETGQLLHWTSSTLDILYLLLTNVIPTRTLANSYHGQLVPSVKTTTTTEVVPSMSTRAGPSTVHAVHALELIGFRKYIYWQSCNLHTQK